MKLSRKAKRAIEAYGLVRCEEAYTLNSRDGEGPSSVAVYLVLKSTRQGDAAINAGRELAALAGDKVALAQVELERRVNLELRLD